jgi:ElaB/YqjD/DUF883 family membrane-anchored ribosome-binding protein
MNTPIESDTTDTRGLPPGKLVADAKVVLEDVEALLAQAASATGERATELRSRANDALRKAKTHLQDAQHAVSTNAKAAARATDDWVHDHPWGAIGIAAGASFLLGLLVARR